MKKLLLFLFVLCLGVVAILQIKPVKQGTKTITVALEKSSLINKDSLTIKSRVNIPKGYKRVTYTKGSFYEYLRNYKLKSFGSKIITTLNISGKLVI